MIDRYTAIGETVEMCSECESETNHMVVSSSSEHGRLGFEGERRECSICGETREVIVA